MKRIPVLTIACILVSGCGSLDVELSVLNPEYVENVQEQAELRASLKEALFESGADIDERYNKLEMAHRQVIEEIQRTYELEAQAIVDNEDEKQFLLELAEPLVSDFDEIYSPQYVSTIQSVNGLNAKIRDEFEVLDVDNVDSKFLVDGRLAVLVKQKQALVQNFQQAILRDTDGIVAEARDMTEGNLNAVVAADKTVQLVSRRLFDQQLWGSPLAYAIASAPQDAWDAKLNRAFGRGQLGNMNVAIKLGKEDDVFGREFTIKGLTFDPSSVANVASKVVTQSLLLAAQIADVPLNSTTTDPNAGSDALAASSSALSQLHATQAERQAAFDDAENALILIARVLLSESEKMTDENVDTRADAVGAFRATYDSHKSRLDVSQTQ